MALEDENGDDGEDKEKEPEVVVLFLYYLQN